MHARQAQFSPVSALYTTDLPALFCFSPLQVKPGLPGHPSALSAAPVGSMSDAVQGQQLPGNLSLSGREAQHQVIRILMLFGEGECMPKMCNKGRGEASVC